MNMAFENLDLGLFVLRLVVAVIFLYHGGMKLLSPSMVAKALGWQSMTVVFLGLLEILGALALVFGVFPQAGALLLMFVMLGAIGFKLFTWKIPFASMQATGWEFDLLIFAAALLVFLGGSGAWVLL